MDISSKRLASRGVPSAPEAVRPAADERRAASGQPLARVEDWRLICGAGRFVDDFLPQDCLHLEFIRPFEQAGAITAVNTSAAAGMPGVVAVFSGADVAACGVAAVNPLLAPDGIAPFELLSSTHHRAPGQAIAAVVATSRLAALDAAEAVSYRLHREAPADLPSFQGSWGSVEPARFAAAAHVIEIEIAHALVAPATLEPRASLAEPYGDGLVLHLATQTPHRTQTDLASVLRLDAAKIRVVAPDVGGAFGGKASLTPEDAMVAFAALRLRRPVKWRATRSEEFLTATRGRGARSRGRLALDAKGKFLAVEADFAFPLGHWWPYSAAAPANNAARIVPGPYRITDVASRVTARARPMAAVNIYRGAGRPEAAMLLERLIDEAAAVTGIDPVSLRMRNFAPPSRQRKTAAGCLLDTGDYGALLLKLVNHAGYAALKRQRAARRRKGEIVGIGIASYVEPCGQGWESGTVGLDRLGAIIAATGTSAQGQGRETAFAQIVADALGVAPAEVAVRHGDTETTPLGIGALASRSTAIGGSAIRKAALAFLALARRQAGDVLGAPEAMVEVSRTGVSIPGGGLCAAKALTWAELAACMDAPARPDGLVLAADTVFEASREAWASGAVLALISIARETGELLIEKLFWADDAGEVINPLLVEGQLVGGMAQGFGEAMMERLVFSEGGELITGSFQDYALPRAEDVPKLEIIKASTRSAANPLGVKGVGEAGCIGVPAAIVNAAVDALRPFGTKHLNMPLTSEKLWRAIRGMEGLAEQ